MSNRVEYGKIEALTGQAIDPVYEFLRSVPYMIEKARSDGRDDAHSYRGFHVAGAAYAINTVEKVADTAFRGNLKRQPKGKVCVEKKLAGHLTKNMTDLVGFVVLGTTNKKAIEAVTGLRTPTLHLCGECRHEIPESPIVSPTTLVVHSGLEDDVNQTFTIGQEADLYARFERGDEDRKLYEALPDFHDWDARLMTYDALTGGHQAALELPFTERQRLAQLALNREVRA